MLEITVIKALAVYPPSVALAVIVAEPIDTAVTSPVLLTVAADELLFHVIALFVALEGVMVAVSCLVAPTVKLTDEVSSEIPVTGITTGAATTFIVAVAVNPPSTVFAVIVVKPTPIALTSPVLLTVADVPAADHRIVLFVAVEGVIVPIS